MKKRLRLIFIAFCVSFAIMAALSLFALKQFSSLIEYSEQVDDTYELISQLYRLENMTKEADVKERSYMLTKDTVLLREFNNIDRQILPATDQLKNFINDDSTQYENLVLLRAILVDKRDNSRLNLAYIESSNVPLTSPYFYKGKTIRLDAINYMDKMRLHAHETLSHRAKVKVYYQEVTFDSIRYLLSIFAFITLVLFFFMIVLLIKFDLC